MELDPRLQQNVRDINRKKKAEAKIESLEKQLIYLRGREKKHKEIIEKEQADVDRLSSRSLSHLFSTSQKKEKELLEQRKKLYEAAVDYDSIVKQIAAVEEDLVKEKKLVASLEDCEERYQYNMECYRATMGGNDAEMVELQATIAQYESHRADLMATIESCKAAKRKADEAFHCLQKARHSGIFAKTAELRIDAAQKKIEELLIAVRRFKNELGDVQRFAEKSAIDTEKFLKFADYFFDDIFETEDVYELKSTVTKVEEIRWKLDEAEAQLHLIDMQIQKKENYLKKKASERDVMGTLYH